MSDDVKNIKVGETLTVAKTHLFYDRDLSATDAGAATVEDVGGKADVVDGPSGGESGAAGRAGETIGDVTKSEASVAQSEVGNAVVMTGGRAGMIGSQSALKSQKAETVLKKISEGTIGIFMGWVDKKNFRAMVKFDGYGNVELPGRMLRTDSAPAPVTEDSPDIAIKFKELAEKLGPEFTRYDSYLFSYDFNAAENAGVTDSIERAACISPTQMYFSRQSSIVNADVAYFKDKKGALRVFAMKEMEPGALVIYPWATTSALLDSKAMLKDCYCIGTKTAYHHGS